jgi:hypothetical protein
LFSPLAVGFIDWFGWQHALVAFGIVTLTMIPLATAVSTPAMDVGKQRGSASQQSLLQALAEAFGHRSYVLLVLGFFTWLPTPVHHASAGLSYRSRSLGRAAPGRSRDWVVQYQPLTAGWLGNRMPALSAVDVISPLVGRYRVHQPAGDHRLCAHLRRGHGSAVAVYGAAYLGAGGDHVRHRWMATLFGFFSHQVAVSWRLARRHAVQRTGSYNAVWWLSVAFGVLSALINRSSRASVAHRYGAA